MRARLIATDDIEGGSVTLDLGGFQVVAMDHLCYGDRPCPEVGEEFELVLDGLYREESAVNAAFLANPHRAMQLRSLGGWSYEALGRIVAAERDAEEAVMVDCGVCVLPAPFDTSGLDQVGEYVGFVIERLDAHQA